MRSHTSFLNIKDKKDIKKDDHSKTLKKICISQKYGIILCHLSRVIVQNSKDMHKNSFKN